MKRRSFVKRVAGVLVLPTSEINRAPSPSQGAQQRSGAGPRILLPSLPNAIPLSEVVLFAFDNRAFPFQNHLRTHLFSSRNGRPVLRPGPEGAHDEVLLYYGTTLRIGDTFHLWYNGNYGPFANHIGYERENCVICYATSRDGVNWEKPDLGLVEFKGSKKNNIVDLNEPALWSTCCVVYDPDDPNPKRRFKMAYEAGLPKGLGKLCVAFSPDGLRWTPYQGNPVGPMFEMAGIIKYQGLYFLNGQDALTRAHHPVRARRLVTFASADFEHWSSCGALSLDRGPDVSGPSTDDDANEYEEVHLGAGLWNRGNVVLGLYGQWHGNFTGDRRLVGIDIGLALSHDAIHFYEPIPNYRIIPAREQRDTPYGIVPALEQGQGMENFGDRTLHWYGTWRGVDGFFPHDPAGSEGAVRRGGVRLCTWERDRLGMLKPFEPSDPETISCPIRVTEGRAKVYINASGLGELSQLRIGLLNQGFRPIDGFGGADAVVIAKNGFREPTVWRGGDSIEPRHGTVRIHVRFEGVRPEDARLHTVYVAG